MQTVTVSLFGTIMIEAAFAGIGFGIIRSYNTVLETLFDFANSLTLMSAEISANLTDIFQIADMLSAGSGAAASFYKKLIILRPQLGESTFADIWSCAVSELGDIPHGCKTQIINLGKALGRYSAEEQTRAISSCLCELHKTIDELRASDNMKKKLTMCVCLCVGTLFSIILV